MAVIFLWRDYFRAQKNCFDMRKKTEQRIVAARLLPRSGMADAAATVTDVTNLRPGPGGCLVPVGEPAVYGGLSGGRLLACLGSSAGQVLLASDGLALLSTPARVPGMPVTKVAGALPAAARCAFVRNEAEAMVMTGAGPVMVTMAGGAPSASPVDYEYPPIGFVAATAGLLSTTVPDRELSATYQGASRLDMRDESAVTGDLERAYASLCASASATGVMIQPALMRYRLRDSGGRVLFTSPAVLVGHVSGAQCASTVPVMSANRRHLDGYTISAYTWRPTVEIPAASDAVAAAVASAEIYMSPLFHPYNPDMEGKIIVGRASDPTEPFIRVGLPGRHCGLGSDFKGASRRTVMKALARMDSIEERVAVIVNPYAGGGRSVTVDCSADPDPAQVARQLSAALRRRVPVAPVHEVTLSAPHTFSAGCCAADASTVAWGNITSRRYKGYPAAVFSGGTSVGSCTVTTVVRFGNGKGVTRTDTFASGMSQSLWPVICYPSPDATELTVTVNTGAKIYSRSFALTPDESGRFAVYVADSPVPLTLAAVASAPASVVDAPSESYPDMVAVAPADNPLAADVFSRLGGGEVRALLARAAADQSWEFGRCRFIAGAAAGIFSVGVGKNRMSLSTRRLCADGISRPDALAQADGGEVFALVGNTAGAGPVLVSIAASGKVAHFDDASHFAALAWNASRGELWAVRTDGTSAVYCRDYGWRRYNRTSPLLTGVAVVAGEPYGSSPSGPVRLCREFAADTCRVALSVDTEAAGAAAVLPSAVRVFMTASELAGFRFEAEAAGITGESLRPVVSAGVSGACRSPLGFSLPDRHSRRLRLSLGGDVSADFMFRFFILDLR